MHPTVARVLGGLGAAAALLCATPVAAAAPPPGPIRMIAEWEPAVGVLITYPFGVPTALVSALAEDEQLYIFVKTAALENECKSALTALGVPLSRATFIRSNHNTHWTRDWGPHQVFAAGQWTVIDPIFAGYPWVAPVCTLITSPGGYVGDNNAPIEFASFFGAPLASLPQYLVGGNFLVDGRGRGFATCTQIAENLQVGTEAQFRQRLADYLGVDDLVVLQPTENNGIQHIDCWFKLVDEETILVKRAPPWHEEYARIESNVAALAALTTAHGRPYRITRIDCPPYSGENIANYCNALILNRTIYVPLFNIPEDAVALATWRGAAPGYEVKGFAWGSWYYYDALHCRTRAVFDRHMLRLAHRRLDAVVAHAGSHAIVATIDDRSEAGLAPSSLRVHYRAAGQLDWSSAPLAPTGNPDEYGGVIPAFPPGDTVEYYLAAADLTGRSETLPRVAPDGYYSFTVAPAGASIEVMTPGGVAAPWTSSAVDVRIVANGEALVPGSAWLHVRFFAGGPFIAIPLAPQGGDLYRAMLPKFVCNDAPAFFASVEGATYGRRTSPPNGASRPIAMAVGQAAEVELLSADFQGGLPAGWARSGLANVGAACAVNPACDPNQWVYFGQTSGCTYSTGARAVGSLKSPAVAIPPLAPGGGAVLEYCSTFVTENTPGFDLGEVLADGVRVDSPAQSAAWQTRTIDVSAVAGSSVSFEWRFDSIDNFYNNYRGWHVDRVALRATAAGCSTPAPFAPGDANCDGAVNFGDIDAFVAALGGLTGYVAQFPDCHWRAADVNGDDAVSFADIDPFVAALSGP